jgi:hypothetical protein
MIDQEFLRKEIYATPFQGNTLVYAPLTRHVALYEGEVSLEDVDPEWLAVAVNPVNVPDFVIKNWVRLRCRKDSPATEYNLSL